MKVVLEGIGFVDDSRLSLCCNFRGSSNNRDSYYRCDDYDDGRIVVVLYCYVAPDVRRDYFGSGYCRVKLGNRSANWKGSRSCSSFLCYYHQTYRAV